jgi:hypothetical protein
MKPRLYVTPKSKPQPTQSLSSPRQGSRMGCLCRNKPIYSTKCCDKTLGAQGIGLIQDSTP